MKEGFAIFHAPAVQCSETTEMRCHDRAAEMCSTGGRGQSRGKSAGMMSVCAAQLQKLPFHPVRKQHSHLCLPQSPLGYLYFIPVQVCKRLLDDEGSEPQLKSFVSAVDRGRVWFSNALNLKMRNWLLVVSPDAQQRFMCDRTAYFRMFWIYF